MTDPQITEPPSNDPLTIGFSPCPNDTFIFYAWVHNLIPAPLIKPHLSDLEDLNNQLLQNNYSLCKGSIALLPKIIENYVMLPVGCALGWDCGPKLISKKPISLEKISSLKVALPGVNTTAHLLLNKLCVPPRRKVFCLYHEIVDKICSGEVDAGVIIHETRFSFEKYGLHEIADLGILWQEQTQLPLPLGGVFAKRTLSPELLTTLSHSIQLSILAGRKHADEAMPYISLHSQEKDLETIKKHMELYVTEESLCLSQKGKFAIEFLLDLDSKQQWLHPLENRCVSSSSLH